MSEQFINEISNSSLIQKKILTKTGLNNFYNKCYNVYFECLDKTPKAGLAIELGAGLGFVKQSIPEILTTDVIPYPGLDQIVDATSMPYEENSIRFIGMINVFHHIPRVQDFLSEAQRCLVPGGRICIVDQHPGLFSKYIYKYLHKENFDDTATDWNFQSRNPLLDANGALAWIVFIRDLNKFESAYPHLKIESYRIHTPLMYWLSGGLKNWNLILGNKLLKAVELLDKIILKISPEFGSFVDIVIAKK